MNKVVIVLDPGHGGEDRYNVGPTGYVEADGNLKLALILRKLVLDSYDNVEVLLTRDEDITMTLTSRGKKGANVDLFHSLHSNAGVAGSRGTEVFYSVDIPGDKNFAAIMSKHIAFAFNTIDRGAKTKESVKYPGEDYMTVVDVAQDSGAKHVLLLETLFHSDLIEETFLKKEYNLEVIARIICDVYGEFLPLQRKLNVSEPVIVRPVSSWAQVAWDKAMLKIGKDGTPINDGKGAKNYVTEEQLMAFFDKLGLLD